jgi:hypothetical protein
MEDQVTDPAFSKFMSDEGAAGTRYFDSRSKQQGFGTQNYVTFPTMDDIIEITGKKAQGGQIPGYAEGGYDDDPSQRYSIPPGSFGLPTPPTPTFQVPIGKGQATVGSNYDMINKIIEAQLGYEHPVGSHGARLGVSGNFNKYIGEGGDQVKPNWGVGLRLNLPFAEGGAVPHFQTGGLKAVGALPEAMRSAIEYFGGLKRNMVPRNVDMWDSSKIPWQAHISGTNAPRDALESWKAMKGYIPHIEEPPREVIDAINKYSGEDYHKMNAIRHHIDPKWWETSDDPEPLLGRWLQKQQYELPYDIYRGAGVRTPDFSALPKGEAPQVHGAGFGSFSFKPNEALQWGRDTLALPEQGFHKETKIPSVVRIPAGTKVPGYPIGDYAEMPNEMEFLMAPGQGFGVNNLNLLEPVPGYPKDGFVPRFILDAQPTGRADPSTPRIYGHGGQYDPYDDIIEAQRLMGAYK